MTEAKNAASGGEGKTLSEGNSEGNANTADQHLEGDKVSLESHKRLLGQYKSAQQKLKEAEAILAEKADAERRLQEEKLTKDGEWQKLVALKEQEAISAKQRAKELELEQTNLKKTLFDAAKMQAVREKLPGQLVRSEYMNFIDVDKVVINPETNEIDEASVDLVVNDFVKSHPSLIKTDPLRLPNGSAKAAGRLSYNEWLKLPAKEKRARMRDVEGFKSQD